MKEYVEYFCEQCNYRTTHKAKYTLHLESNKHNRGGGLLPKKCSECDYEAFTHWNLKMHYAKVHSTKEEREKYKYYCPICDYVFFCSAYYKKHIEGIKHQQKVKDQHDEINL